MQTQTQSYKDWPVHTYTQVYNHTQWQIKECERILKKALSTQAAPTPMPHSQVNPWTYQE